MASRILNSTAPASVILIRIIVGWVFLSEGIQKFLFPAALGAGRFAKIGLPVVISVAIWTTKIPMLAKQGFWAMAHESRTDFCMLFGLIFLLIAGAGRLSLDATLRRGTAR